MITIDFKMAFPLLTDLHVFHCERQVNLSEVWGDIRKCIYMLIPLYLCMLCVTVGITDTEREKKKGGIESKKRGESGVENQKESATQRGTGERSS